MSGLRPLKIRVAEVWNDLNLTNVIFFADVVLINLHSSRPASRLSRCTL